MKKSILNLEGVQQFNKKAQSKINGGNTGIQCYTNAACQILGSLPSMEYEEFFCYWGYCQIA